MFLSVASPIQADYNPRDYDDDEFTMQSERDLKRYVEPLWFQRIAEEDESGLLKRCFKKDVPPNNGDRCARRAKVCYFDTQDCDGMGAHPVTKCYCDGRNGSQTWSCEPEACPGVYPDPTRTGCAPIVNDPSCPLGSPTTNACSSVDFPVTCNYQMESWLVRQLSSYEYIAQ